MRFERKLDLSNAYVSAIWWHEAPNFGILCRPGKTGDWLIVVDCGSRQTSFSAPPGLPEEKALEQCRGIFLSEPHPHKEILLQTEDAELIRSAVLSVPFIAPIATAPGGTA